MQIERCGPQRYLRGVQPLALLALLSGPVWAQERSPNGPEEAEIQARAVLDDALNAYVDGDLTGARSALLKLVNDPSVDDPALLQEARVWLGEIEYFMGEQAAARSTFRTVLVYDPTYRMDPFVHPPEVIAFFDSVRAEVAVSQPDLVRPPAPALPLWLVAPFPGGMQFRNGNPVLGATTLMGVTTLGATTIGLRVWLVAQDLDPDRAGIQIGPDDAGLVRGLRRFQLTAGSACAAVWLTTAVVGFSLRTPTGAAVHLQATPTGARVALRF